MWAQSHLTKPREPKREARVEYFVHKTAQAQRGSACAHAHTARKGPCHHHSTFYPFLACFSSFWWCLKLVNSQTKVNNLDLQEMTSPGKQTNQVCFPSTVVIWLEPTGQQVLITPRKLLHLPPCHQHLLPCSTPLFRGARQSCNWTQMEMGVPQKAELKWKRETQGSVKWHSRNPILRSCSLQIDPASLYLTYTPPKQHLFLEPQDGSGVEGSQGLALASDWASIVLISCVSLSRLPALSELQFLHPGKWGK